MYRGEGKTDARDAAIIADQARVRRDLRPMQQRDTVARDLQILTARRADVRIDHTREVSRLREQLAEYFPRWNAFWTSPSPRAHWCCSALSPRPRR